LKKKQNVQYALYKSIFIDFKINKSLFCFKVFMIFKILFLKKKKSRKKMNSHRCLFFMAFVLVMVSALFLCDKETLAKREAIACTCPCCTCCQNTSNTTTPNACNLIISGCDCLNVGHNWC
jgi:hypothetical protein